MTLPVCVMAQRPFTMDDPFYRDETARRNFFDGIALTGRFNYRSAGMLSNNTAPLLSMGPLSPGMPLQEGTSTTTQTGSIGLTLNLDYELAPQLDLSGIFDVVGGTPGSSLSLSWIALKRYWFANGTDFALRLAFDPRPAVTSSNALGLRQIDLAGMVHAAIRPNVSVDMLGGVRRVRIGFERLVSVNTTSALVQAGTPQVLSSDLTVTRANGEEIHLLIQTNFHFNEARSHVFAAALFEGGRYDVEEHFLRRMLSGDNEREVTEYLGHVFWLRAGIRWNKPSYQVAPFLSVPMALWKSGEDELDGLARLRTSLGVSLTLR
jgi:hypothetical protein